MSAVSEIFARIREASAAIYPQVSVTPLQQSRLISAELGCEVLLKYEHMQPTGSFKIRGATNKVRLLDQQSRRAGVLTASTGNHGVAVARAGGLIGGTGSAIKALNPRVRVVGVWPEASQCLLRALEAGRIVPCEEQPSLSDGTLGAVEPGSATFPICQSVIDSRVVVSETEIAAALSQLLETEDLMVEGAAGVALAGLVKCAQAYRGRKVAVVLCGRNIGPKRFMTVCATSSKPRWQNAIPPQ